MQEITSVNNELVKYAVKLQQKKYRDSENKFLLEGRKCVEEAICAGISIEHVFILKEKANIYNYKNVILTSEAVLKKISTTDSAPDIVAIAFKQQLQMPKNAKKVILLENIKDLGNLGTILRTSVAFGADCVILYGNECADIYNPKCVRSAVGNLWKIPVIYMNSIIEFQTKFKNFQKIATLPKSNNYLKNFELSFPAVVMFGSEADGLSDKLINISDNQVKIEMSNNVESLNLSVSCAVVMYSLFKSFQI